MRVNKVKLSYLKENNYLPDEEMVILDIEDVEMKEDGSSIFLETKQAHVNFSLSDFDRVFDLEMKTNKGAKSVKVNFVRDLSTNTLLKLKFEYHVPKVQFLNIRL
ncbi:hypothetical protein [Bacillus atrophaeus]|uniref:hypothetical protein n=1 Tax=Bacillus atrophaeus TaxID=1452 RepID=UPI002E1BD448|nr:hypothetical protein [Bacillus atrophaeus]